MYNFFLGNGSKRPKLIEYKREFGWQGEMFYQLDKANYEKKIKEKKELKEINQQSAKYWKGRSWF